MEKLPFAVSATDHVAAPVAAGLTFALGVEQQIQGDICLSQLIPESIQHFKTVVALKPAIRCGDQQVDIGIWPGLATRPGAEQAHLTARNGLVDQGCHRWQPLLDRWRVRRGHTAILLGLIPSARRLSIQQGFRDVWKRLGVSPKHWAQLALSQALSDLSPAWLKALPAA